MQGNIDYDAEETFAFAIRISSKIDVRVQRRRCNVVHDTLLRTFGYFRCRYFVISGVNIFNVTSFRCFWEIPNVYINKKHITGFN